MDRHKADLLREAQREPVQEVGWGALVQQQRHLAVGPLALVRTYPWSPPQAGYRILAVVRARRALAEEEWQHRRIDRNRVAFLAMIVVVLMKAPATMALPLKQNRCLSEKG